jgi:tRNA threonylcarbamoyladenosine dehydratase
MEESEETLTAWNALPEDFRERFGGLARLYGREAVARFHAATVTVVGVGGVGSWVVEALARSAVGHLRLIDLDDVCITNVNRQLPALDGELGKAKVEVLAERCRKINPHCRVEPILAFVAPQNFAELLAKDACGVLVDCIDRAAVKAGMLAYGLQEKIPLVTVGGAGGRRDPLRVRAADLTQTEGDPLLKAVRKILKKQHGLPRFPGKKLGLPCIFSNEPLQAPLEEGSCTVSGSDTPPRSLRMDCASGYGAVTHVTAAFGLAAAAQVLVKLK